MCAYPFLSLTTVRPPPLPATLPPPIDDYSPSNKTNNHNTSKPTELLEASLKSLRLNEKPEFRSGAGKLISMMLEARVPTDNTPTPETSFLTTSKRPQPFKSKDLVDTSMPIIPIPPPLIPAKNEKSLNSNLAHQSPSFKSLVNIIPQLPEPQSVLVKSFDQQPVQSTAQPKSPKLLSSEIPPNPSADPFPTPSPTESSPERAPVVLRQRNGANKSASHARDRRSFIEKDGVQQVLDTLSVGADRNRLVGGSSIDMLPAGSISDDGLWNGAAPVCCVCKAKIQR